MEILRKFFPSILTENDSAYFAHLEGVIGSVDELCSLQITRSPESYSFRLASSHPKYNDMLIQELLQFHTLFKIRLELSKSIKTTGTIVFKIKLNN